MVGVNIPVVKVRFSREAMTEQQRKNLGSLLACAAILALIALVLLARFDGFEAVSETELPKQIDFIHIAEHTSGNFKKRFTLRDRQERIEAVREARRLARGKRVTS